MSTLAIGLIRWRLRLRTLVHHRGIIARHVNARLEAERKAAALKEELDRLTVTPKLHCSFCSKSQNDVRKLIAGPNVFICDECTLLCVGICMDRKEAA